MEKKPIVMFYPFMAESAPQKVAELLKTRWLGQGKKVDEFEEKLKSKFNWPNAVTVNSGTASIRLALALAGVGPGDEVISPSQTSTATNHPILEQFAKPVFADSKYETLNIDPDDIEHRITDKTKAIICVHWGGYPCDLDELNKIARDHNLVLIEDAAHALGAKYKGKSIGSISDFNCFSLQSIKQMTTADGGILTVKDPKLFESALRRRWFGIDRKNRKASHMGYFQNDVSESGFKYHMNNIAATIGLEQLKHFDRIHKRRADIVKRYREELEGVKGVTLLESKNDRQSANWLFTMHVDKRKDFCELMGENNIEASVVDSRNDVHSIFGGLRKDLPGVDKLSKTMVSIPLHNHLTDEDVDRVISTIKKGW
jgi:perosamine synthetase